MTWGEALRLRAADRGYRTQKELASAVGASISTVGLWCVSKDCPTFRMGNDQKLLEVLGLETLDQLRKLHHLMRQRLERQRAIRERLRESEPIDIPLGVILVALIHRGVTADIIDLIVEKIGGNREFLDDVNWQSDEDAEKETRQAS